MNIDRYVMVRAIKTSDNELIPIWDGRLTYGKDSECGSYLRIKDKYGEIFSTVECVYDLKTRTLSSGIELNHYPEKLDFEKDEEVYYEIKYRQLDISKIIEIVYNTFDINITKGNKIEDWWVGYFKDVDFVADKLYCIKQWKPTYILESGFKTEYSHELYHKLK